MLNQIVGILAEEILGIKVEYVYCEDELQCLLGLLPDCLGWQDYHCLQGQQVY